MISVETYDSLASASAAMGRNSRFLGGGTLLMQRVNYGNLDFDRIVRCRDPELINIQAEPNGIRIGAAVTMAAIAASRQLDFLAPVAARIGGPAIRNMATLGGNLFAASPFGDLTAALLALDGRVHFAGGSEISLEALLARRGTGGDIVRAVTVRRPGPGEFRFRKTSRVKPKGVSILSIAALLPRRAERISGARIAFAAMGPTPLRAKSAEAALEGKMLDKNGVEAAQDVVMNGLTPEDDALASAWYRRETATVHLRRLLLEPNE